MLSNLTVPAKTILISESKLWLTNFDICLRIKGLFGMSFSEECPLLRGVARGGDDRDFGPGRRIP